MLFRIRLWQLLLRRQPPLPPPLSNKNLKQGPRQYQAIDEI